MNDLIDRQAAIDLLRKRLIETANNNVGFICDAGQVFEDASERIRYWIDELPSAQPEPNCSEIPNNSDTISRQAAIDEIDEWIKAFLESGHRESAADACLIQNGIIQLPSAQPEIIACGDCKYWICHDSRCGIWNHGVKPLDWCSYAERRTDG